MLVVLPSLDIDVEVEGVVDVEEEEVREIFVDVLVSLVDHRLLILGEGGVIASWYSSTSESVMSP